MSNKLQGKDFINIGIFTAIYFVIIMAAGMLGVIPIFIPLLSVIVPLLGGIPMMLYFSKVKKFGMITIQGLLSGILMMVAGMGYWCVGTFFVAALICDLILKADGYKSAKKKLLAYGVYATSVASAVASGRPIIIFDEPTSGLDLENMKKVSDCANELAQNGKTVIIVTHDPEFILRCCDDVIHIENGKQINRYCLSDAAGREKLLCFFKERNWFPLPPSTEK